MNYIEEIRSLVRECYTQSQMVYSSARKATPYGYRMSFYSVYPTDIEIERLNIELKQRIPVTAFAYVEKVRYAGRGLRIAIKTNEELKFVNRL